MYIAAHTIISNTLELSSHDYGLGLSGTWIIK